MPPTFDQEFARIFDASFQRVFRVIDRLGDDAELAADVAQEAFVRLYRRGALPDDPEAWLVSVAANLARNALSTRARRRRLLTERRAEEVLADPAASPLESAGADDERARARAALDRLPPRERELLLLRAEGFSYREIATALDLHEASIGTLLARAKREFRAVFEASIHAS